MALELAAVPPLLSLGSTAAGLFLGGDQVNQDRSPGPQEDQMRLYYEAMQNPDLQRPAQIAENVRAYRSPNIPQVPSSSPLFETGAGLLPHAAEFGRLAMGPSREAWERGLNASDVANNKQFQDMLGSLRNEATSMFMEQLAPQIRRSSIGGGTYGGGRDDVANALAAEHAVRGFANEASRFSMDAYNRALSHEQGLLGQTGQQVGMGFIPGQQYMDAGMNQNTMQQRAQQAALNQGNFNLNEMQAKNTAGIQQQQSDWDVVRNQFDLGEGISNRSAQNPPQVQRGYGPTAAALGNYGAGFLEWANQNDFWEQFGSNGGNSGQANNAYSRGSNVAPYGQQAYDF